MRRAGNSAGSFMKKRSDRTHELNAKPRADYGSAIYFRD